MLFLPFLVAMLPSCHGAFVLLEAGATRRSPSELDATVRLRRRRGL